jgi:hypothetical protein
LPLIACAPLPPTLRAAAFLPPMFPGPRAQPQGSGGNSSPKNAYCSGAWAGLRRGEKGGWAARPRAAQSWQKAAHCAGQGALLKSENERRPHRVRRGGAWRQRIGAPCFCYHVHALAASGPAGGALVCALPLCNCGPRHDLISSAGSCCGGARPRRDATAGAHGACLRTVDACLLASGRMGAGGVGMRGALAHTSCYRRLTVARLIAAGGRRTQSGAQGSQTAGAASWFLLSDSRC